MALRAFIQPLCLVLCAAATTADFVEDEIVEEIATTFKCRKFPALSVSVVRDGQILLSRGYGIGDTVRQTPVTNTTLFGLASLSKSFAATLLVKLLSDSTNLTVDSPVRELLPDKFRMPDTFRTRETTFADIMAHRTGVPPNNFMRFDTNLTRDTLLDRLHLLPAPKQFRVKYYYSNLMYGLVTRLAEIIGGQSWEDLIMKELFQPLGMHSSTFASTVDFNRPDVAAGYEEINGKFFKVNPDFSRRWAELAGSGSVMSTAEDMARWMNFHLFKGLNMQGQRIMSERDLAEVHKPRFLISSHSDKEMRVPQFPVTSSGDVYSHGFIHGFYRGFEQLSHSGSTQGYKAYITLLPRQKIGVFVALTGQDPNMEYRVPLTLYLLDRALDLQPWLNVTTICSYPEPWKNRPQPPEPTQSNAGARLRYVVQEYEGTYYNDAYGHLHVIYNETVSSLIMNYGWGKWQLVYDLATADQGTLEKFHGVAMETTLLNVRQLYFVTGIQDKTNKIIAVNVTSFEPEVPPVFEKIKSASEIMKACVTNVLLNVLAYLVFINI